MSGKQQVLAVLESQPDDASYEDIVRELAFKRMVDRGLEDARSGKVISNDEMERRIRQWRK